MAHKSEGGGDKRIISPHLFDFAKERFEIMIEDLLDDPSHLLHPLRDREPAEEFKMYRQFAAEFGLDFDELCQKLGSPIEIERCQKIERGEITPAPKEDLKPKFVSLPTGYYPNSIPGATDKIL